MSTYSQRSRSAQPDVHGVFARLWRAAQLRVDLRGMVGPEDLDRELGPDGRQRLDRLITDLVLDQLASSWERGWQPADIIHLASKASAPLGPLAAAMIVRQADVAGARGQAPAAWTGQLETAAELAGGLIGVGGADWSVVRALVAAGSTFTEAAYTGCGLAATLARLPVLEALLPPPSTWGRPSTHPPAHSSADSSADSSTQRVGSARPGHEKVLSRIRALLAKAESTDYAAEAEALTAKAQELMTRHAIDEARVAVGHEQLTVVGRRVHLDAPYPLQKATLLAKVARANRAQAIYANRLAIATVVGTPADLDVVEMLFTSLLIQATRAMTEQTTTSRRGSGGVGSPGRTTSFRRTFLTYAVRIGERLSQANATVATNAGTDLVPLFARQEAAVSEEYARLFPRTVRRESRAHLDDHGWRAGTAAADRAVFTTGRVTA